MKSDLLELARGSMRIWQVVGLWLATALSFSGLIYVLAPPASPPAKWFATWLVLSALGLIALRLSLRRIARRWHRNGRLAKRAVLVGAGEHGHRYAEWFAAQNANEFNELNLIAYFDDRRARVPREIAGLHYHGSVDDLVERLAADRIDEVLIALPWSAVGRIAEITRKLQRAAVAVRLMPEAIAFELTGSQDQHKIVASALTLVDRPIDGWHLVAKNSMDKLMAGAALLLLSPVMAAVALAIKLDSPGPVFFRQERLGLSGKPFGVLKFRTMRHALDANVALRQAKRNDPRLTRLGGILRKTSFDELPQLFNVLKGDMSLVGPRPHPVWRSASELWADLGDRPLAEVVKDYEWRHRVKPGITGLAQIKGLRGGTETVDKMQGRIDMDIEYISSWSPGLDLKILLQTLNALVGKNAY